MTILRLPEIDSTNLEARRRIAKGEQGPLWIAAGRQSAGRGRFDRTWVSRPGNLHTSLILKPKRPLREAACLSLLAGVAVRQTVAGSLPDVEVQLKWPNDVLIEGAKVAGILLESEGNPEDPTLIVGIGINVAWAPDDLPYPATALAQHRQDIDLEDVFRSLRADFDALWDLYRRQGFSPVRDKWLAAATGLGAPLEVRLPGQTLAGGFGGLDRTGALLLNTAEGPLAITAGDVFFAPDQEKREL